MLPKKPGTPSLDSAQRVNAGVLFEQEKIAAETGPARASNDEGAGVVSAAAQPQAPKPEQPLVKPLQTFQGDIESLVGEKQISVVSIAAAEADKRAPQSTGPAPAQEGRPWLKKSLFIAAGMVLLASAGGVGYYIYMRMQPVPLAQQAPAPFILVDDTKTVVLKPGDETRQIMDALMRAKQGTQLALGLVARIQVAKAGPLGDGSLVEVSAPEFLQALAPEMPLQLVRTLEPQMLLGLHSFDENQAFMILKADSYETAYAGMLSWEDTMYADLMPLFGRTPAVHARPAVVNPAPVVSTTTAATTTQAPQATSTLSATTTITVGTPPSPVKFFEGTFSDKVVENRDARVMLNQEDDIILLWTMLDRSTIVIANNDATLREIISRLSQASTLSLPAGR